MVGMEGIHAYQRFTFGIHEIGGGIDLIPAMVGAFGLAEILSVMKRGEAGVLAKAIDRVVPRPGDIWRDTRKIVCSGRIRTGRLGREGGREEVWHDVVNSTGGGAI